MCSSTQIYIWIYFNEYINNYYINQKIIKLWNEISERGTYESDVRKYIYGCLWQGKIKQNERE